MSDCIFCKIIAGEIPSHVIYEDSEFKAILDAFPAAKGHVLILPKNHICDVFEIEEEQAGRLFKLAVKIAKEMEKLDFVDGINILQNNKTIAGQTVYHFHMHLIPRKKGDDVQIGWKTSSYAEGEAAEYIEKFGKLKGVD